MLVVYRMFSQSGNAVSDQMKMAQNVLCSTVDCGDLILDEVSIVLIPLNADRGKRIVNMSGLKHRP